MEDVVKHLRALIALHLRASAGKDEGPMIKAELVLSGLGFTAKEIAGFTGKSVPAVAKAISRARGASPTKEVTE